MVLLPTGVLNMNELSFAMQTEALHEKILHRKSCLHRNKPGLTMRQNGKILDICSISIFQFILQAHCALEVCAQFQPYCNQSKP